jgi:hypothetical protein
VLGQALVYVRKLAHPTRDNDLIIASPVTHCAT